ncbi:MAG: zinc ribbon domain-containing protein [Candidatus Kapaibacteriota bacterium]
MSTQSHLLAALSYLDQRLDELNEEFGDLPEIEKDKKQQLINSKIQIDETEAILKDLKSFITTAKTTLMDLKEKEDKLTKQQFLVRNNKEFDAISKEIEAIKQEHSTLSSKLRSEGIKEENLIKILEEQKNKYTELENEITKIRAEIEELAGEQKEEIRQLRQTKDKIEKQIKILYLKEYNRIRKNHNDTAVQIKKNSCSGCFSAVTSQRIVEVRNNKNQLYLCEHCGRILLPDDIEINETLISELISVIE